jgi:hypothetical protein
MFPQSNMTTVLAALRRRLRFRLRVLFGFAALVAILLAAIVVPERKRRATVAHFEGLRAVVSTARSVPAWIRLPGPEPGFREIVGLDLSCKPRAGRETIHEDWHHDGAEPLSELKLYFLFENSSATPFRSGPPLSADDLAPLRHCRLCALLNLDGTLVDDDMMRVIGSLPLLQFLSLIGTKVTDTGLTSVTHLDRLEHLSLSGPSITDASVPSLIQLKSLRVLKLVGTRVTGNGLAKLRQALPELEINWGDKWHYPDGYLASESPLGVRCLL